MTIQAQILDMMRELQDVNGTSMILITHDLGIVAEMCDYCAVMYAGEIVEYGTVEDIFNKAKHPYTKALYRSIPSLEEEVKRLHVIQGLVPNPADLPEYCSFYQRCEERKDCCKKCDPQRVRLDAVHEVKCCQYTEGWEEE